MYVCENCFSSDLVSDYITTKGHRLRADFICKSCGKRSTYRLDKYDFKDKIQSIIREHFEHENRHGLIQSAKSYAKPDKDPISAFLTAKLYNLRDISYELFEIDDEQAFYDLLIDSTSDYYDTEFNCDSYEENWINTGRDWDGSSRIELNWNKFCENVKNKTGHFNLSSYDTIVELSKIRRTFDTLANNFSKTLYRARKANDDKKLKTIIDYHKKELGIATPEKAGHNRFSPKGIPYVYLSEDYETTIKEIKKEENCNRFVVGEFSIINLKLVDLRKENVENIRKDIFHEKCTAQILCSAKTILNFLADITKEVKKEDNHLEYIPTQIVSKYICSLGYDGFIFDSSLCNGTNYVLFKDTYEYIDYKIIEI